MVRGIGKIEKKKKKKGLMADKDYITEAYLQGGKAVGKLAKKRLKKEKVNSYLFLEFFFMLVKCNSNKPLR